MNSRCWPESRSAAASNRSLIFVQKHGSIALHMANKPGLRQAPIPMYAGSRDLEDRSGLFGCETTEKTHFHHLCPPRVDLRQSGERLIQSYQVRIEDT